MRYYIVHSHRYGYYVGWGVSEDEYNQNFVFAKKYKTIGGALNRAGIEDHGSLSVKLITALENNEDIFNKTHSRIDVVSIPNERKRKLCKINGENCDALKFLGRISNDELIKYFRKKADKFLNSLEGKYFKMSDTVTATDEYIDDWCSHMDNVLEKD